MNKDEIKSVDTKFPNNKLNFNNLKSTIMIFNGHE